MRSLFHVLVPHVYDLLNHSTTSAWQLLHISCVISMTTRADTRCLLASQFPPYQHATLLSFKLVGDSVWLHTIWWLLELPSDASMQQLCSHNICNSILQDINLTMTQQNHLIQNVCVIMYRSYYQTHWRNFSPEHFDHLLSSSSYWHLVPPESIPQSTWH